MITELLGKGGEGGAMQTQGRENLKKVRVAIAVNNTDKQSKIMIKHCLLAPGDAHPSRGRSCAELKLTLLVKSSSTKVATLPLIPMKRFTLVRTT